jgi:hypothetical protein
VLLAAKVEGWEAASDVRSPSVGNEPPVFMHLPEEWSQAVDVDRFYQVLLAW